MTSYGATTINIIDLKVSESFVVGGDCDEKDVKAVSIRGNVEVDHVEIENEIFTWGVEDIPRVKIFLTAKSGYEFPESPKTVDVSGATYAEGLLEDAEHYIVTVAFESFANRVGEISQVTVSADGIGGWKEALNAGEYEIFVYRNNQSVSTPFTVSGTSFSLKDRFKGPGSYDFKVRAVCKNAPEVKSRWYRSNAVYFDESAIAAVQAADAGAEPKQQNSGEWKLEGERWWFRNGDGSYTRENWQEINGERYYFDGEGYMRTGWIEWDGGRYYCDALKGSMVVNTKIPDGDRMVVIGGDGKAM